MNRGRHACFVYFFHFRSMFVWKSVCLARFVVHTYNACTWEDVAGRLQNRGWSGLHSETLSQEKSVIYLGWAICHQESHFNCQTLHHRSVDSGEGIFFCRGVWDHLFSGITFLQVIHTLCKKRTCTERRRGWFSIAFYFILERNP
jgi:hypothetical protein